MNAIAIYHEDTTYVPAFWWTNIATHEVQSGDWVPEEDKHLYEVKGYYDADFEAEIAMNNYEKEDCYE